MKIIERDLVYGDELFSRPEQIELALQKRVQYFENQGKRVALVAVIHPDAREGYMVGIAVENERGYYPTHTIIAEKNYHLAEGLVDEANELMFSGRSKRDTMDIIITTMRK
jgi:hypothetical protein